MWKNWLTLKGIAALLLLACLSACRPDSEVDQTSAQAGSPAQSAPKQEVRQIPFPVPMVYRDGTLDVASVQDSASIEPETEAAPESSSSSVRRELRSSSSESSSSEAPSSSSICANAPEGTLCDERDGHIYRLVAIGSQVWMGQNLNYKAEGSWCYDNKAENCNIYGRLYSWVSAMGLDAAYANASAADMIQEEHQGICPDGFHVPTDNEMKALVRYITKHNKHPEENTGTLLKKTVSWNLSEDWPTGMDRFGFGALAAGSRNAKGEFRDMGRDADFWIAEESNTPTHAPYWNLYYDNDEFLGDYSKQKTFAYSVRCLKNKKAKAAPAAADSTSQAAPADTTGK